jgi:DNA transposition AAA+ family ATPase
MTELSARGETVRSTWNWSLDNIRERTGHYPREVQELLIAVHRWCTDDRHPMRRADVAIRLGYSPNLLYQIYTGVYRDPKDRSLRAPSEEFIKRVREFIELEQRRYNSGRTEFVMTPTARKVFTACELARESQTPVILWSTSHIGKTWALRQFQQANNHGRTFLAELEAASGLAGMVRTIADACGISDKSNTAKLLERIKRALTPNSLLIVDEVHLLKHTYRLNSFFASIEVLRRIYDRCHCGMVLSWTNLDNLRAASQGELIQMWRRGVHKIALPDMPTKGDIGAILQHTGLEFPARDLRVTLETKKPLVESPYEVLRSLAKNDGLLAITERLRYAKKLASRQELKRPAWQHFLEAHLRIEREAIPDPNWD